MRVRKALGDMIREYDIFPRRTKYDPHLFLYNSMIKIRNKIMKWKKKNGGIKYQLSLNVCLGKYNLDTSENFEIKPWFQSCIQIVLGKYNIDDKIRGSFSTILAFFDAFLYMGSGWFLKEVLLVRLSMFKYNPLGGQDKDVVKEILAKKKSVLNITGCGNLCFVYCVLACIHKVKNAATRASTYVPFLSELDISGITFPVKLNKISKFEKKNCISINVFGMFKGEAGSYQPYPMYISSYSSTAQSKADRSNGRGELHVDLLLYHDHYYLIRDLSMFIRPFFYKTTRFYCRKCLLSFWEKDRYQLHIRNNCHEMTYTGQAYILPEVGAKLQFADHKKQVKCPFIIYADFETYSKKLEQKTSRGMSEIKTEHKLNAFGAIMLSKYGVYSQAPFLYVGRNVIKKFVSYLHQKRAEIAYILQNNRKTISLTSEDILRISNQKKCYICNIPFHDEATRKVLDHAHIGREGSGRDVNYACNRCNLTYTSLRMDQITIPIVIHNSMQFDSHFLIQKLYKYIEKNVRVLARSSEKFLTLSFENFHVIDSFQFLPTSLSKLADTLSQNDFSDFVQTKRHIKKKELLTYVTRKGVMCYDYIDSWKKLSETKLPCIKQFYNTLTKQHLPPSEYQHAVHMFDVLQCRNIKDYLKEYLKIDVLLLSDVFESFRNKAITYYNLDPAKYLTAPALSYQAMLKYTGVKLELITDTEIYHFIEDGIRGGITNVSRRMAHTEGADDRIIYLDCVSLYGYSMCEFLPYSTFQWVQQDKIKKFNVETIREDNDIGYILEATLLYPNEIHEQHNSYPLAPERQVIQFEDLSPYAKKILHDSNIKYSKSGKKLICSLNKKVKYILHYRNLQLYLKLGMKIDQIHRILSFRQSPWMKCYIDFNNEKRKQASSSFDREFFKLMNNSAFGKTMENVKKRKNMRLISDQKTCKKMIEKPTFHSLHIFNKDYVGIQYHKESILLNKPIYLGFTILELSKCHMYSFHYNIMLPMFKTAIIDLLYTDTDSLIYYIKDKNYIEKMQKMKYHFDFSNMEEEHPLHCTENKKVLGKFKDESAGREICEFIALRPKMYSILYKSGVEEKRVKGVKKSAIQEMRHALFRSTLLENKFVYKTFDTMRSLKHKVYVISQKKLSLSPFEDKRYLLQDGIHSMAYGNCKIPVSCDKTVTDNFFVSKRMKVL